MLRCVAVAFCFMVGAAVHCYAALEPLVLTPQDLSIKRPIDSKWCNGHQCTQTERDFINDDRLGVAIPMAGRFADVVCRNPLKSVQYNLSTTFTRFAIRKPYHDIEGNPFNGGDDSQWVVGLGGATHYYDGHTAALAAMANFLAGSSCSSTCGKNITPQLADMLDIRVENGKCVKGADFPDPGATPAGVAYDSGLATKAPATAKVKQVPPTGNALTLLHATHVAHAANVACRCGEPECDPNANVMAAHLAYEATAFDESSRHFRRMMRFLGDPDPRWSQGDVCKLFKRADFAHGAWMACQEKGDWGCSRQAEQLHQRVHNCIYWKAEYLKYKFPSLVAANGDSPDQTCGQFVASLP